METIQLGQHTVRFWDASSARKDAPVIFLAQGENSGEEWKEITQCLEKAECRLVGFESKQWNDAYSPWASDTLFPGQESFGGQGKQTLQWLEEEAVPTAEKYFSIRETCRRAVAGYSLAGLFALWAFYTGGCFSGCASCSGSLWYPGWPEFITGHRAPRTSAVYLSLGRKEERTRNAVMAAVGERTRETLRQLQNDSSVECCELEWHPGGHFLDTSRRSARGIEWLSQHL